MIKRTVTIKCNEHANLDSFPFRYGFSFDQDTQLELEDVRNQNNFKNEKGRYHIDANFVNPKTNKINKGHFVLIENSINTVATVWRLDSGSTRQAEHVLSETLKAARLKKLITVVDLINMHDQGLKSHFEFSEFLAKKWSQKIANEIIKEAEDKVNTLSEALRKTVGERDKYKKELNLKSKELEEYKKEQEEAKIEGSSPTLADERVLVKVSTDVMHNGSICTQLSMSDGNELFMKIATFDRDLSITDKAKSLEGKKVRTTCWDPIGKPGYWSSKGYFRNVYEVVDIDSKDLIHEKRRAARVDRNESQYDAKSGFNSDDSDWGYYDHDTDFDIDEDGNIQK
jgi:hypothetical protein